MKEVGWTWHYLDDLEADFLALYGVEDILSYPAARFFRLAERLPAYRGVIQARVLQESEQPSAPVQPTTTPQHPIQQRLALRETGGEVATVASNQPSYLGERLKEAGS